MASFDYTIHAKSGQNLGQAAAEELARFLETWAPTFDGRTAKGRDIRHAAQLVRRAQSLIERHDGFK